MPDDFGRNFFRVKRFGHPVKDAVQSAQYDLAAAARKSGVRRKQVVIRPITMTRALEQDLYALVRIPVDTWQDRIETILNGYDAGVAQIVDSADGTVKASIDGADVTVSGVVAAASLSDQVAAWLSKVVGWHTVKWSASVKAALGVDVYPFINVAANQPQINAMLTRITSLITSVSDQARKDVAEVVWREFLKRTPRREVGKMLMERIGIARSRANLIASDQANKVSAELTRIRQLEAGISRFKWTTAHDDRVRPTHAALDGKIFAWDSPPSIGFPGTPVRCRCTGAAVLDLDE